MYKIKVHSMCYQTYPCQHYCTINNVNKLLNGLEIKKLLIENNMTDTKDYEHFKKYK